MKPYVYAYTEVVYQDQKCCLGRHLNSEGSGTQMPVKLIFQGSNYIFVSHIRFLKTFSYKTS